MLGRNRDRRLTNGILTGSTGITVLSGPGRTALPLATADQSTCPHSAFRNPRSAFPSIICHLSFIRASGENDAVPSVSIHLFNHVDDAWEHDLRFWLEKGTKAALSGQKVWMVCRSFLQANWLRRRAMEERMPIMGVRFFDLRRLRRELCLRAGLPTPSFGRETLSLLLRARMEETEAASADQSKQLR